MNPDITLVNADDRPNLQVLRQLLNQTQDVEVIYVHVNHLCPTPNHIYSAHCALTKIFNKDVQTAQYVVMNFE